MAFKRSAVRSRLSPPENTGFHHEVRCFSYFLFFHLTFFYRLRVFQANKQQRFDPAYLHQKLRNLRISELFFRFESLSGKQTTAVRSRLSPPRPDFFGNQVFFTPRVFQVNKEDGPQAAQHKYHIIPVFPCPSAVSLTFFGYSYGTSHLEKSPFPRYHNVTTKE